MINLCISSLLRRSVRKGVLRNLAQLKWKHLCQSLFLKKESLVQVFSSEFCEISKNIFFTEHLWATGSRPLKTFQGVQNRSLTWNGSGCWLWLCNFIEKRTLHRCYPIVLRNFSHQLFTKLMWTIASIILHPTFDVAG